MRIDREPLFAYIETQVEISQLTKTDSVISVYSAVHQIERRRSTSAHAQSHSIRCVMAGIDG
jgi:hypothetical protein